MLVCQETCLPSLLNDKLGSVLVRGCVPETYVHFDKDRVICKRVGRVNSRDVLPKVSTRADDVPVRRGPGRPRKVVEV